MNVVFLPDGYNGDLVICNASPVAHDGDLVKLQVVEKGKEFMHRWIHIDDLRQLLSGCEASI